MFSHLCSQLPAPISNVQIKMHYNLTAEEESVVREQQDALPDGKSSMQRGSLRLSVSGWGAEHLSALRVVHLDNQPLTRLFGPQNIPRTKQDDELNQSDLYKCH